MPDSALGKGNPAVQSLITAADVEKVGGFSGIKQVLDGDNVTFRTQDNKLMLKVEVHVRGDRLYKVDKDSENFHANVSGIGDDAFDGPSDKFNMGLSSADGNKQPYFLWFLKANTSVRLMTYVDRSQPRFYLTQDKLRQMAKIVASRL